MQQNVINELQKILWYIEEYNNGNNDYLSEMIDISHGIKKNIKSSRKNYVIFSLLNLYLDMGIKITSQELYEETEYQNLIQYCKDDIKYYLDVSKMLKAYINKCLKTDSYEHLDTAYILTIKNSYILKSISDYFAHIRSIQRYAMSGIQYQFPNDIRKEGELNIEEIEESLMILGLRREN